VLGLVGEAIGRQMHYQQLSGRLTAEKTQAERDRTGSLDQASRLDPLLTHERLQERVDWLNQLATWFKGHGGK